jgi:hypothetical protein
MIKIPLKYIISICFSKKIGQRYVQKSEKISEVIQKLIKNQYFLNKKYRRLAFLREEASNSLLPVDLKNIKNMFFG